MNTLLVAAVLQGLSSGFDILYTDIGKEYAEKVLRKHLAALFPNERENLTVFNVGTTGSSLHERGTLLYPTKAKAFNNEELQDISLIEWDANKYLKCYPAVCYSSDVFIDTDNQHLLDTIEHDCVDMEIFTLATICKEFGVRIISLKLVSDCFNVTFEQWKASLSEVVSNLTQAIETLKINNII